MRVSTFIGVRVCLCIRNCDFDSKFCDWCLARKFKSYSEDFKPSIQIDTTFASRNDDARNVIELGDGFLFLDLYKII